MWKLRFFLLPSGDYRSITLDELKRLDDNLDFLQKNEKICIPKDFFDKADCNEITVYDYIFEEGQTDLTDYLMEIVSKQRHSDITYEELKEETEIGYLVIRHSDSLSGYENICVERTKDIEEEKYVEVNDVIKVKRYYLEKVTSFEEYKDRVEACFQNIVFHEEAFRYINSLGKCTDVILELTRHLKILNDVGKKLYEYYGRNEKRTLNELKSAYGIECSGKGSNEEKSFNKDIVFNNKKFRLTCNPHTKLFKKYTDQRIYFCWGVMKLENMI